VNGSFLDGQLDDVILINRALTPEEVLDLYKIGPYRDTPWLIINPTTGNIQGNSSEQVQVILNAFDLVPGSYETNLSFWDNVGVHPRINIPIILNVTRSIYLPSIIK
jgi:hypothetical protein